MEEELLEYMVPDNFEAKPTPETKESDLRQIILCCHPFCRNRIAQVAVGPGG